MRLFQQLGQILERRRQRRVAPGEGAEFLGGEGWIGGLTGWQHVDAGWPFHEGNGLLGVLLQHYKAHTRFGAAVRRVSTGDLTARDEMMDAARALLSPMVSHGASVAGAMPARYSHRR